MKLNFDDTFDATTIRECCQQVFNCKATPMKCWFVPKSLIKQFGNEYTAWFVNLDGTISDDGKGRVWRNLLILDKNIITEEFLGEQDRLTPYDTAKSEDKKITFMKLYDKPFGYKNRKIVGFKFVGVFIEQNSTYENGQFKSKQFLKIANQFEF